MDSRLNVLSGNIVLPNDIINKINGHICENEGMVFDKVKRTGMEKFIYAVKIIFTLGICILYYNQMYFNSLRLNSIKSAKHYIKLGANPDLTTEKIIKLVKMRNLISLHFAVSQCTFDMPSEYNCQHRKIYTLYESNSKKYWAALHSLKNADRAFLYNIFEKQSHNNVNLEKQLTLYNDGKLNIGCYDCALENISSRNEFYYTPSYSWDRWNPDNSHMIIPI